MPLFLYGRLAADPTVMIARDEKQDTEVHFRVDQPTADALWESMVGNRVAIADIDPAAVVAVEAVPWHAYRPGLPARND